MSGRLSIRLTLVLALLATTSGCAGFRIPAIDPSGRSIFLPSPNYTQIAPDSPLGRFAPGRAPAATPQASGPYEPALFNKHRPLADHFGRRGASSSVFPTPESPPACGPDGRAPDGGPCYPVGSPSARSLQTTLPVTPVGTGLTGTGVTAANPLGLGRLAQVGPRVVLERSNYVASIGDEIFVLGGIRSPSGVMRAGEPVRWALSADSAGTLIDYGPKPSGPHRHGFLSKQQLPRHCGHCVETATSARCGVLPTRTQTPGIRLTRGQTWVSLTSGGEGISHVTLSAPSLAMGRQATARVIWVDADVQFPRPSLSSLEGPAPLVTKVVRRSDGRARAGYLVRYTVLADGVDARLNQDGDRTITVQTDAEGNALANVYPNTGRTGTTRLSIEVLRPEGAEALRLREGLGYVTWSEDAPLRDPSTDTTTPPIDSGPGPESTPPIVEGEGSTNRTFLTLDARPVSPTSTLGDETTLRAVITNAGNEAARQVRLQVQPDRGQEFVSANPPASPRGTLLLWDLGDIPAGGQRDVEIRFRTTQVGTHVAQFNVQGTNTSARSSQTTTTANRQPIEIRVSDPQPFLPRVGETVNFTITVTNHSDQPITAQLNDDYSAGLRPVLAPAEGNAEGQIKLNDFRIPARASETVPLSFEVLREGTHTHRVTLTGYDASAEGTVRAQAAAAPPPAQGALNRLKVEWTLGEDNLQAGQRATHRITISNPTADTVRGVRISYTSNDDLYVVGGQGNFTLSEGGKVRTWVIPDTFPFLPDTELVLELELEASRNPAQTMASNEVRVWSDRGLEVEGALDIRIVE